VTAAVLPGPHAARHKPPDPKEMTMRLRLLIALAAILTIALAACGDDAAEPDVEAPDGEEPAEDLGLDEEGVIRVGSDIDFPPFEFIEDGEIKGFDVDLMEEVATRLDLEVEWIDAAFDTILAQLAGGEFDVVISAVTITEERAQTVDFSDPYFEATQALLVGPDSDIGGVDDLAGAQVGAQAGTTGEDYATENFTESEIVNFPTYPAAFAALESDQIDAVLADLPAAAEQEARSELVIAEVVDTGELYGIVVQQGNEGLLQAVNDTLAEVIDDGTYEEIYGRWFEGDLPERFAR
jgi:ABC-type amino acid transport substrate-binding protein